MRTNLAKYKNLNKFISYSLNLNQIVKIINIFCNWKLIEAFKYKLKDENAFIIFNINHKLITHEIFKLSLYNFFQVFFNFDNIILSIFYNSQKYSINYLGNKSDIYKSFY